MSRLTGARLLHGETVTLRTPTITYDEHRERVETWAEEQVADVVVAPGSTSDVADSDRPDGTRTGFSLAFPRTFSASLRGCHVVVRGIECAVVGDPQPNDPANCPTGWLTTCDVEACDG